MTRTWFISDTHFNHHNILKFVDSNGDKLRPFTSIEDMNEFMRESWKRVVCKDDIVYHLGDVAMKKKDIKFMDGLPGRKVLVKGNHDVYGNSEYLKYFDRIEAYHIIPKQKLIFSHIPIHSESHKYNWINIHGHTHANMVKMKTGRFFKKQIDDPRYINICVEHTNYRPIEFNEILAMCEERKSRREWKVANVSKY